MVLRRLTPEDAVAYRAMMLEAYSGTPIVFGTAPHEAVAQPDSWWRARCSADPDSAQLVIGAFDDDKLVGVLGVQFAQRERERHKATLFGMFVKPAARGAGVGRALIEAALEAARAREGVRVAQLAAIDGNDGALRLYERCGFVRWGVEPMCFANPEREFVARVQLWREL